MLIVTRCMLELSLHAMVMFSNVSTTGLSKHIRQRAVALLSLCEMPGPRVRSDLYLQVHLHDHHIVEHGPSILTVKEVHLLCLPGNHAEKCHSENIHRILYMADILRSDHKCS